MLHWQQLLIRPAFTPFSAFCSRVSGFSHDQLMAAKRAYSFATAIQELDIFIQTYFISQNKTFTFATHGESELRFHLVREAKEKGVMLAPYYSVFFEIGTQVRLWHEGYLQQQQEQQAISGYQQKLVAPSALSVPAVAATPPLQPPTNGNSAGLPSVKKPENNSAGISFPATSSGELPVTSVTSTAPAVSPSLPLNMSLVALCHSVGIQHEGRLHCGIDSAVTIAKIAITVLAVAQGLLAVPASPPSAYQPGSRVREIPFTNPTNLGTLVADFYATESKIVIIYGIPFNVTVLDVQSWLRQVNLVPTQLWMLKTGEGRPDGSGYAVFNTHSDAHLCLVNLNGRAMNGRAIQVGPATEREFELTRPLRAPFPTAQEIAVTSMTAPDTKPGDWFCPSCQFHNFANRVVCKQCNSPAGAATAIARGSVGGNVNSGMAYKSVTVLAGGPTMKPGDWICTNMSCRFQNFQSRMECHKCRSPRPPGTGVAATVGTGFKPGDWVCGGCNKHNFASRTVCMQCGRPNDGANVSVATGPATHTGGGGGPRPTDRPGDWACPVPACRYHNYASRTECYRCGTPKR
ncbi:hypothetical protein HDU82_005302 [Entophlyctis luteolus]|nr:hypothetical protein HDU82_005302 [Entophlyctis luteolus]